MDPSSCISVFEPQSIEGVPSHSVNKEQPSGEQQNKGDKCWITRVKLNEEKNSLEVYNLDTESILFIDENIRFIIEYDKNKLFATGHPTCMFLINDWVNVRCI